jgi:hypothetical protein
MIPIIRDADMIDYMKFYSSDRYQGKCLWVDGMRKAMGGLIRDDDRTWGYLDVKGALDKETGLSVIRAARKVLRRAGEAVYVTCDEAQYGNAPRLLKALGFEKTDEVLNGYEVWRWTLE